MADVKLFKCLPIPAGDHKDVYELQPIRMVLLHNRTSVPPANATRVLSALAVIIRGFNSVLYYSSQVKPGTKGFDSFIRYSAAVVCHSSRAIVVLS